MWPAADARPVPTLRVVRAGLMTTVQDLGRWGYQSWGVSVAGPMDPWSHRLANHLVGNEEVAATLEVTLAGPELVCDADTVVAVSGARFDVQVGPGGGGGGQSLPHASAVCVPGGATLTFGSRIAGARAYLAVRGGLDVRPVLGSRATHVMGGVGGLDGRALKAGDAIPIGTAISRDPLWAREDGDDWLPRGEATVRVLLGSQAEWFEPVAIERLLAGRFVIAGASNRMAFRLEGPLLPRRRDIEMLSEATAVGHVQVPASGQPILLMADRQTVGGYPRIATVIGADIGLAAQLAPGDGLRFERCDRAAAVRALLREEQRLVRARDRKTGRRGPQT